MYQNFRANSERSMRKMGNGVVIDITDIIRIILGLPGDGTKRK